MELISLDIETTGTDPRLHRPWEVALVAEDGTKYLWQLPLSERELSNASPEALKIGGFYERYDLEQAQHAIRQSALLASGAGQSPTEVAWEIARLTDGRILLGCAVHFDATFLGNWMRRQGVQPSWHHRHLDLGSFVAGFKGRPTPLSSRTMQEIVPNEEEHTALGDALWNWKVYETVVS